MNKTLLANLAAGGAALFAGASVVATRVAVGEVDPVGVAFLRYVIAVACLAPALPLIWPKGGLPWIEVGKIALLGLLFFGFFTWAFSAALHYTTAARGAIGLATVPIQTLLVAVLFGRERLSWVAVASVALAFAGVATVFGPAALRDGDTTMLIGDGLMLLGVLGAAIYSVFGRPTFGRNGPMLVTTLGMAFGVLGLAPLALAGGVVETVQHLDGKTWLALAFLGTFGGAIQFSLFNWALRWLPPTRTVLYLTLNPITAMVLAVALLGERVGPTLVAGLLLVLSAIAVANWPRAARKAPAT